MSQWLLSLALALVAQSAEGTLVLFVSNESQPRANCSSLEPCPWATAFTRIAESTETSSTINFLPSRSVIIPDALICSLLNSSVRFLQLQSSLPSSATSKPFVSLQSPYPFECPAFANRTLTRLVLLNLRISTTSSHVSLSRSSNLIVFDGLDIFSRAPACTSISLADTSLLLLNSVLVNVCLNLNGVNTTITNTSMSNISFADALVAAVSFTAAPLRVEASFFSTFEIPAFLLDAATVSMSNSVFRDMKTNVFEHVTSPTNPLPKISFRSCRFERIAGTALNLLAVNAIIADCSFLLVGNG